MFIDSKSHYESLRTVDILEDIQRNDTTVNSEELDPRSIVNFVDTHVTNNVVDTEPLEVHNIADSDPLIQENSIPENLRNLDTDVPVQKQKKVREKDNVLCNVCGKMFDYRFTYNRHMKSHNKEPIYCDRCNKYFRSNYNKSSHTCK